MPIRRHDEDDRHLAAYLALRFRESPRLSVRELVAEGMEDPLRVVGRPGVIAHLGHYGVRVRRRRGGRLLVAEPLEPLLAAEDRAPAAPRAEDDEYLHLPPEAPYVRAVLRGGYFPFLSGPTGSGKSTLLKRVMLDLAGPGPVYKVSMTGATSVDDLFGVRSLREGRTSFQPGPALLAMREQRPLILEELDAAPPEVLFALHELAPRWSRDLGDSVRAQCRRRPAQRAEGRARPARVVHALEAG